MKRVTLTLHYPTGAPTKNGTIYTHDAILNAFCEANTKQIPIIDYAHNERGKVVGIATPSAYYTEYNGCSINNDCFFFDDTYIKEFDMECVINKFHKDQDGVTVIDDFRITGMSITEDEYEQTQST